jgi:hypothetical protein
MGHLHIIGLLFRSAAAAPLVEVAKAFAINYFHNPTGLASHGPSITGSMTVIEGSTTRLECQLLQSLSTLGKGAKPSAAEFSR